MKALLMDPRIRLFSPDPSGLEDAAPLFDPDTFVYFDRNGAGDPFDHPDYIQIFRTILTAVREEKWLQIQYLSKRHQELHYLCVPVFLEYSLKDDRFRAHVMTDSGTNATILNLSQITSCSEADVRADLIPAGRAERHDIIREETPKQTITLELVDQRNALERLLLHFSSMEKEVKRTDEDRYLVKLTYDLADETEMVIRILSFGPMIQVIGPESMREKIKERLARQLSAFSR